MLPVEHQVGGGGLAVFLPGPVLAEVRTADQLPDHQKVDAPVHDLRAEGAGAAQLRDQLGGTEVGVQPHARPEGQQPLLRADGRVDGIPLGPAHGGEKGRVARKTRLQAGGGQGDAEGVNGVSAHGGVGIAEGVAKAAGHRVQDRQGLGHDLRADAVAPDHRDRFFHGVSQSFPAAWREAISPPFWIISLMKSGKGWAW